MATMTPDPPDFLTVEEAARVLRIGRTAAYALARMWRATHGREGLPVVLFGRLLRVPRAALEEIAGGPITAAAIINDRSQLASRSQPTVVESRRPQSPSATNHRPRQRSRSATTDQPTLPLT